MRRFTVLFPVILSLLLVLAAGCSMAGEVQTLRAENERLEKRLAEITLRCERLQRSLERAEEFGMKPKATDTQKVEKPVAIEKVRPSRILTFSEKDLDALARRRAKTELADLNLSIAAVTEMHGKVGNGTLEYAKAYAALETKQTLTRGSQKFFQELIEPSLLEMPPAPSEEIRTQYAAELAEEQARLVEEARLLAVREEAERKAAEDKATLEATRRAAEDAAAAAKAAAAKQREEILVPRLRDGIYVLE